MTRTSFTGLAAVGLLVVGLAVASAMSRDPSPERDRARAAGAVEVRVGASVVLRAGVDQLRRFSSRRLGRWLGKVPATRRDRQGRAVVTLRVDRPALRRAVNRAIATGGGSVSVPERAIASSVRLRAVKQALRNNCETAALSMLLDAAGVGARQLALQRQLPRSGPLDPSPAPDGGPPAWGDPRRGFVGRPDGGGTSGGYGVYEAPIRALARKRGVQLEDLSRTAPEAVYRRLLSGRPVMVWVGLSDGPFMTWRTPGGHRFTGNFGEHTVLLTGIGRDGIALNDPLPGKRTTWTRARFEQLWRRLGRRALSL